MDEFFDHAWAGDEEYVTDFLTDLCGEASDLKSFTYKFDGDPEVVIHFKSMTRNLIMTLTKTSSRVLGNLTTATGARPRNSLVAVIDDFNERYG